MTTTATTTATTEAIVHGIHVLSLNKHTHDYNNTTKDYYHHKHQQPDYYYSSDDQTSDITVITMKEDVTSKSTTITPTTTTTVAHQDWLDEIEHSFDNNSSYHQNNSNNNDFYDNHHSIIQSYLEPTRIQHPSNIQPPPVVLPIHVSKFSLMKSRVKRVFGISNCETSKSLPVFSTNWTPSIDSSICSSTTTAAATSSSISSSFRDTASTCSIKKSNRHSCGLSTASFKYNKPSMADTEDEAKKSAKSILKKQQQRKSVFSTTTTPHAPLQPRRRKSFNEKLDQKRKRWSRISIIATPSSKRLSTMLKRKKPNSTEMFTGTETKIKFNKYVNVHETWSQNEYDRSSDPEAVCTRLTAILAQQIKQELNHFKLHEMSVHDSSRIHTHFFL